MRIGPSLTGSYDGTLDALADWLEARDDDPAPAVERHPGALVVDLHPAAAPVRITLDGARIALSASTVTAGPGYHRHVIALAEAMPGVTWAEGGDDTGWRRARDDEALEGVFLDWLGAAVAQIVELGADGMSGFALAMPAGIAYEHDGLVATQLGPRDEAWVQRARVAPEDAVDVFPWWGPGRDAAYYRDLALGRMWQTIRWRPPLTEDERAAQEAAVTWIEKAHGLDPDRSLPWAEQSELLTYLEEDSLRATRAHLKAQELPPPSIGYRRRPVRVEVSGGWHLTVPGELAERWDDRGTWVAWDETRSVFFNSFTAQGEGEPTTEQTLASMPPLDGGEILELKADALRGYAALSEVEEDGRPMHRLEAHAAIGPHAAIGTLVFVEPTDREWALSTWGSLGRR